MRLTAAELDLTREKLAKINKRAAKRGFTGALDLAVEPVTVRETNWLGQVIVKELFDVTVTGEPPKYNGWAFLATLTWTEGNLVTRNAPGVESIGDRDGFREGWCDQCRLDRDRNDVYLVENVETGERKQVGSTCIKDFLGWDARPVFFSEAEVSADLDDWGGGGGTLNPVFGTDSALAIAWAAIKAFGFRRSGDAMSTVEDVRLLLGLYKPSDADRQRMEVIRPFIASSEQAAREVRAYVLSDAFGGQSDYVDNLKAVLASDRVTDRNLGLLASAPQAWAREQERTLIREREQAAGAASAWIGAPKQRLRGLVLTVKGVRYLSSDWGATTLLTFADADENVVKWFASGTYEYDLGTVLTLDGTVKKQDEFNGVKQTVLTRCTVKDIREPADA